MKEQADNLDQIYTEIAQSDAYAEHVIRLAQIVLEKRYSAAERLMPGIEELRQKLAVRGERLGPEMQPFQESVDTAVDWLALYDSLYRRLLKLAAARQRRGWGFACSAGRRRGRPRSAEPRVYG